MRKKGFILLPLPHRSPSLKEARAGTQTGHEPGHAEPMAEHGRVLLPDLLSSFCSASFLSPFNLPRSGTAHNGLGPPVVSNNKMIHGLPPGQPYEVFSQLRYLFSISLAYATLKTKQIKTNQVRWLIHLT